MPYPKPNITDQYDRERMRAVEGVIRLPRDDGRIDPNKTSQMYEYARTQVISMRDAITIAEMTSEQRLKKFDLLSPDQQKMVYEVMRERTSAQGRFLTDQASAGDLWLTSDRAMGTVGYYFYMKSGKEGHLLGLDLSQSPGGILHHELTHFDLRWNNKSDPPPGLSSFDQGLWRMGNEARASMSGLLNFEGRSVSADEKRSIFGLMMRQPYYLEDFKIEAAPRSDGRRLTVDEFAEAFGAMPGESANFLKGYYAELDDIWMSSSKSGILYDAWMKTKPELEYENLPKPAAGVRYFETADKSYVIAVRDRIDQGISCELYARQGDAKNSKYLKVDYETGQPEYGSGIPQLRLLDFKKDNESFSAGFTINHSSSGRLSIEGVLRTGQGKGDLFKIYEITPDGSRHALSNPVAENTSRDSINEWARFNTNLPAEGVLPRTFGANAAAPVVQAEAAPVIAPTGPRAG